MDADGKFALAGLWPDVQYRLLVKLPGHERYASAMLQAAADKTHDLGKITLARTVETVEGTVLDTAGKPIAGARVFNAGDGPDPMETRTDAAGRFRLTGFRKGPACVFAMNDGYQFAGLRTTAGATDATIKMLRNDEPAPKRPIAVAAIPPEEQKKLARALLEKAWDIVKNKKKPAAGSLRPRRWSRIVGGSVDARKDVAAGQRAAIVELMEKIDAEQAKRWASESSAKHAGESPAAPIEEDACAASDSEDRRRRHRRGAEHVGQEPGAKRPAASGFDRPFRRKGPRQGPALCRGGRRSGAEPRPAGPHDRNCPLGRNGRSPWQQGRGQEAHRRGRRHRRPLENQQPIRLRHSARSPWPSRPTTPPGPSPC